MTDIYVYDFYFDVALAFASSFSDSTGICTIHHVQFLMYRAYAQFYFADSICVQ